VTIRRILISGEPVLHSPTRLVTTFDSGLRTLVTDMFDTMYAGVGVGLAANQIGVGLRVFVYDCPAAEGDWHAGVVVNPVLRTSVLPERASDPKTDMEGCMSVPAEGYPLIRAPWATVNGFDLHGNAIEVSGSGVLARCFQHETDHLDGRLYLDRLHGEYAAAARAMVAERGWGSPGNSWLPELPGGEIARISRDTPVTGDLERGPISSEPVHIPIEIALTRSPAPSPGLVQA
jgi:peptide deformylase